MSSSANKPAALWVFARGSFLCDLFDDDFKKEYCKLPDYKALNIVVSHKVVEDNTSNISIFMIFVFGARAIVPINLINQFYDSVIYATIRRYISINKSINNELITSLYQNMLEKPRTRSMLNAGCSFITEMMDGYLGLYYGISRWGKKARGSNYLYLAGSSSAIQPEIENERYKLDEGILGYIYSETKNSIFYEGDLYREEKISTHRLDHLLEKLGLSSPEIYGTKVSYNRNTPYGIFLLFNDSKLEAGDRRFNPNKAEILSNASKHLANIIHSREIEWYDEKLFNSQKVLLNGVVDLMKCKNEKEYLFAFQRLAKHCFTDDVKGIVSPGAFVIFERKKNKYEIYDNNILDTSSLEPPVFRIGDGLTGKAMFSPNGEIYEPAVEYSKGAKDDCKDYWDDVTRTRERVFYGKHVRIGFRDFMFVLVGARGESFNPDHVYNYLLEIMGQISTKFVEICDLLVEIGRFKFEQPLPENREDFDFEVNLLVNLIMRDSEGFEFSKSGSSEVDAVKIQVVSLIEKYSEADGSEESSSPKAFAIKKAISELPEIISPIYKSGKMLVEMVKWAD